MVWPLVGLSRQIKLLFISRLVIKLWRFTFELAGVFFFSYYFYLGCIFYWSGNSKTRVGRNAAACGSWWKIYGDFGKFDWTAVESFFLFFSWGNRYLSNSIQSNFKTCTHLIITSREGRFLLLLHQDTISFFANFCKACLSFPRVSSFWKYTWSVHEITGLCRVHDPQLM